MFTIRVPATTANLGPGFDCIGLALNLYNEIRVELNAKNEFRLEIEGWGAEELKKPENNLFLQACQEIFVRCEQKMPGLNVFFLNKIPGGAGLGSSAAALVAGLVAGNLLLGEPFTRQDLLEIATTLEGHPDNVAPALLGGCVVAVKTENRVEWLRWEVPAEELAAIAVVPRYLLATKVSRQVLPRTVSFADAVFNVNRVALLVGAFAQKAWDKLAVAMTDRLHQPYRMPLIPGLNEALAAAQEAGAYGTALSGAGPTILALVAPERKQQVAEAVKEALKKKGISSDAYLLSPANRGVWIET
ncbi:homoserine kinase [Carboxydocella sporoproducens DSM 16521]|uniref:Homoserine kinase n=2 Tax=Carboxydocella TaxID=178898 RepID=A0A1T4RNR8_9FIRM|nr:MULTISPECIES: homoserine kinase [Carboxydocella]AVX20429.1 homoserine kinase [Carboxydocella thermautotrophica]AVX30851.1 homoserine kinase [Carboxydocella thermautotrophica]SKA17583.1 homoserine kinase [Carboxydocella sporoproducens DSM 16521]